MYLDVRNVSPQKVTLKHFILLKTLTMMIGSQLIAGQRPVRVNDFPIAFDLPINLRGVP